MLKTFAIRDNRIVKIGQGEDANFEEALWIDLIEPTKEEEQKVEQIIGIEVPTREEMKEIELSNRFYEADEAIYMTAAIVAKSGTEQADAHEITFILAKGKLITLRYVEPQSFKMFMRQKIKFPIKGKHMAECMLAGLLGSFINRIADITEKIDTQIDIISGQIFKNEAARKGKASTQHFQRIIKELGLAGDLISKIQESLISIQRLISFLLPQLSEATRKDMTKRLDFIVKDSVALREHTSYLIDKVTFMLDATLGMINIQQNDIMKIFSIATVCFLPGTLITGFFGMNFKSMDPMLNWGYGYEATLAVIILSIVVPFGIFKRKGWL